MSCACVFVMSGLFVRFVRFVRFGVGFKKRKRPQVRGAPDTLPAGEAFIPAGRNVAVFRDGEGVFAISTVCTHLGCIVKTSANGFDCPCHGSGFTKDGTVRKGPAPKPLPWLKVSTSGGTITIDEESKVKAGTKV